jgi:hypothetical protein
MTTMVQAAPAPAMWGLTVSVAASAQTPGYEGGVWVRGSYLSDKVQVSLLVF